MSPRSIILLSPVKKEVIFSESRAKYAQIKLWSGLDGFYQLFALFTSQNGSQQICWWRKHYGLIFWPQVTNTTLHFTRYLLMTGVMCITCELLWCFYQLFGLMQRILWWASDTVLHFSKSTLVKDKGMDTTSVARLGGPLGNSPVLLLLSPSKTPLTTAKAKFLDTSVLGVEIDRYIGLPIFEHFTIIGYRFCKKWKLYIYIYIYFVTCTIILLFICPLTLFEYSSV